MTRKRQPMPPRHRVYCAEGHEMLSGPMERRDKLNALADDLGCGYGACGSKRANS